MRYRLPSASPERSNHPLHRARRDLWKLFHRIPKLNNLYDAAVDHATSIRYYCGSSIISFSPAKVFRVDTVPVFPVARRHERLGGFATKASEDPVRCARIVGFTAGSKFEILCIERAARNARFVIKRKGIRNQDERGYRGNPCDGRCRIYWKRNR